jgi:hypothetical protein
MGEAQLFIKPTYKIKNNLKYIDAYWWKWIIRV